MRVLSSGSGWDYDAASHRSGSPPDWQVNPTAIENFPGAKPSDIVPRLVFAVIHQPGFNPRTKHHN
jgi:hypothetical protein